MIKYTRLGYVWRLCSLFKYFNQLPNIRELYIRLFGEESVWEGALLSPILPQRMDSICVWAESVIGEDPARSQVGLGSSSAPHSQDL